LLSAWFAFFIPCYATFKALSNRPISESELQKWAMYWSVIGAFVAFEYVAEWFISWLPFYWEVKTLFLLFLSLPQTQGSTYIYTAYLQPLFSRNEHHLDAIQQNMLAFIQAKLATLWTMVGKKLPQGQAATSTANWPFTSSTWSSVLNGFHPSAPPATMPHIPSSSRHNSDSSVRSTD
jgi:receptor expression-enhancing protein 1/2/3/4